MKNIFLLLVIIVSVSCDNGDFEIPSFTFTDTVNYCGTYVLYKTNTDKNEAFILQLNTTVIQNSITTEPRKLNISATNTQYRIFDGALGTNYFCQAVPPDSPITIKKWDGVPGSDSYISVETEEILDDDDDITGYKHTIKIHNLKLENGTDSIVYENYAYGIITTNL